MPRKARQKEKESIYHIMCRSVSEFLLFRDNDDKDYYLELLKRYTEKFKCGLYAYCLMDNHLHLHLDPRGYDVSKFMQSLNVAYIRYYNRKYKRHGHVFQERFESRILDSDEYNLTVSAYIHNNPKDVEGYSGREEEYPYSSYGIYLGIRKDTRKLIDLGFMMGLFNTGDRERFSQRYREYATHCRDTGNSVRKLKELGSAVENEYRSGRTVMLREWSPSRVITYISGRLLKGREDGLKLKSKTRVGEYRAFCAYVLRVLSGLGYKEICEAMYNITVSGCSVLCDRGYDLVTKDRRYGKLFRQLSGLRIA